MKRVSIVIFIILITFVFDTKILGDTIYNTYSKYLIDHNIKIVSNDNFLKTNKYHNEDISNTIKETDDYLVDNKSELINVYYTAVNNGYDSLTFYCSKE